MYGRFAAVAIVLAASLLGCAGSAWRQARNEDSICGLSRASSRSIPRAGSAIRRARGSSSRGSRSTRRARPRMRSRKVHRDSGSARGADPLVEELFFATRARWEPPTSYREFLDRYPSGALSTRAAGNLAYLETRRLRRRSGRARRDSLREHPDERLRRGGQAKRGGPCVCASTTAFDRIGVVVEVDPATPGADRLRRVFRDRAVAAYSAAGMVSETSRRRRQRTRVERRRRADDSARGARDCRRARTGPPHGARIVARTEVRSAARGEAEPIWSDTFEYRAPLSARRDDVSILFSPGSHSSYWADLDGEFFVPIARWSTDSIAKRAPRIPEARGRSRSRGKPRRRAVRRRRFPAVRLRRSRRLDTRGRISPRARSREVRRGAVEGSRVAIFGSDGIEIVVFDGERPGASGSWVARASDRSSVPSRRWRVAGRRRIAACCSSTWRVGVRCGRWCRGPILGHGARARRSLRLHRGASLYVASLASSRRAGSRPSCAWGAASPRSGSALAVGPRWCSARAMPCGWTCDSAAPRLSRGSAARRRAESSTPRWSAIGCS